MFKQRCRVINLILVGGNENMELWKLGRHIKDKSRILTAIASLIFIAE